MKYKASFFAPILVVLMIGFTSNAFGAIGFTRTADVNFPGSPAATNVVLAAFTATESGAGADNLLTITVENSGNGTGAMLTRLSIYVDVNANSAFDFNDTLVAGATTTTTANYTNGGPLITLTPTTPEAFILNQVKKYLLVANFATTVTDGNVFGATLAGTATTGAIAFGGAAQTAQAAQVTATHFLFKTTGYKLQVATGAEILQGAPADLLWAVDDYSNLDVDYAGEVQFKAESYTDGSNVTANLTAGLTAGDTDVKLGAGAFASLVAGKLTSNIGGAAGTMHTLLFATAGPVTLVAVADPANTGGDDLGLEGSVTISNQAYQTVSGVQGTRGIELYDTNHNGHVDHATIFFDAPVTAGATPATAFTIAGYTTGVTVTGSNYDAGGTGIRNAGEYGVTLAWTELSGFDTNAVPQITYNQSVGFIVDKTGPAVAAPTINAAGAIEVDKARPILLSITTNDLNGDGIVDGIKLTFSESVTNLDATATQYASGGALGTSAVALRNTLQGGGATTISLSGTVTSQPTNVVIVNVNPTIPNTGILPVLLHNENSAANSIQDLATSATGAAAHNTLVTLFTTYVANTGKDINVTDGVSPIITNVQTVDANPANGKIDRLVVTFSEPMNAVNANSFTGVSGYSSVPGFGTAAAGTYTVTAGTVAGNTITYTITPAAGTVYDTEAKPTILYDPSLGDLKDANGFELAQYAVTASLPLIYAVDPTVIIDGAPPYLVSRVTGDNVAWDTGSTKTTATAADGRIDTIVLTYSEAITTTNYAAASTANKPAALDASLVQFVLAHENAAGITLLTRTTGAVAGLGGNVVVSTPSLANTGTYGTTDTQGTITLTVQEFTNAALTGFNNTRNGGDTGSLPTVAYTAGGGGAAAGDAIKDLADVAAANAGAAASADGAKPFVMAIETGDMVGKVNSITGEDIGNGDGYIDNFLFKMSETTRITLATTVSGFSVSEAATATKGTNAAATNNTFTMIGFDSNANTGAFDLVPAVNPTGALTEDDNVFWAFSGAGLGQAKLYTTNNKNGLGYDTGCVPYVSYNGTNNVKDAAGLALAAFTNFVTTDKTPPVIVAATGSVNTNEIVVTFSEKISDATSNANLVGGTVLSSAHFAYSNRGTPTDNSATAIASVAVPYVAVPAVTGYIAAVGTDQTRIKVKTNAVIRVGDDDNDYIYLTLTGIQDQSQTVAGNPGGNLAVFDNIVPTTDGEIGPLSDKSIMFSINDLIKPYITAASTMDIDNDGWIDHIKLTLKDADIDVTKFGTAYVADTSNAGFATVAFDAIGWDIANFTGEKWDFTKASGLLGCWAPGTPNLVYLKVDENNAATTNTFSGIGDTHQAPVITSSAATMPQDFKGNPYTSTPMTDANILALANVTAAIDAVGPVIMDGAFTSTTELHVRLSEQVKTTTRTFAAAQADRFAFAFNMLVDTNRSTMWNSQAKEFEQNAAGYIKAIFPNYPIPAGNDAKIAYVGTNKFDDLATAAVANIATTTEASISAWIPGAGAKSLALTYPTGGEAFRTNSTVIVQWNAMNTVAADSVDVYTSADGGSTWTLAAGSRTLASAGAFSWTAPAVAGSNLKVKAQLTTDAAVKAVSAGVFNVSADAPVVKMITVLWPNGGEVYTVGDAVNVKFATAGMAATDSVDVSMSTNGGVTFTKLNTASIAASAGLFTYTAAFANNILIKVASTADATIYDASNAVFSVKALTTTPSLPAVTKAVVNPAPSTMAAINNVNVTAVKFTGTATAGDTIAVKLVDVAGLASAVTTVVANAAGNFSGTVNASPLAQGLVTLMAGKVIPNTGAAVTYLSFADYLKDAVTIGAPTALVVADVPGDNGGFVTINFETSPQHPGKPGATPFNTVQSYQLYKRGNVGADTLWTAWATFTAYTQYVQGVQGVATTKLQVVIPTVKNGLMQWKLVASVMGGSSGATAPVAGGATKVAELLNGVDKAAEGLYSEPSNEASGGSVDNLLPTAPTVVAADNTPGAGITVSWTPKLDNGIVAGYTFNELTLPIYGVNSYEVYRKVQGAATYPTTPVGSVGRDATSFVDATVTKGTTVYAYSIKLIDDNPDHLVKTTDFLAMYAVGGADFNSDSKVDLVDLGMLGQAWGKKRSDATWISLYDLNNDGKIAVEDLGLLGKAWGATKTPKLASAVPTVNNPFELKAEVNENNAMYLVNINVKDAATVNGVAFTLNYDTKAFEFVKESVTGLGGLSFANENNLGVIEVASLFQNEKFNGTITLGFKSKGLNSDMILKMSNAEIAINDVVSAVTGAPAMTLKALPTVYGMSQNFPNPFNPSTTIQYSVPKTSHVELAIYNMAGQKVTTLVNTNQAASFYRVVWNGKNDLGQSVASGMYFYKLVAGNYNKVIKMNLIK